MAMAAIHSNGELIHFPNLAFLLTVYQGQQGGQIRLHQVSLPRHSWSEAIHRTRGDHDVRREPRLRQTAALGRY